MAGWFLGEVSAPVSTAGGILGRLAAFPWSGWDRVSLYHPGQAGQLLAKLTQAAERCANPVDMGNTTSLPAIPGVDVPAVHESMRVHLVPLHGMGDEALDAQVRITGTRQTRSGTVAADWIIIRSGDYLLTVDEMGNPLYQNKYLMEAAQAAWRKLRKGLETFSAKR